MKGTVFQHRHSYCEVSGSQSGKVGLFLFCFGFFFQERHAQCSISLNLLAS